MRLAYFAFTPDSLTYTVIRALSECGHTVSFSAFASPKDGMLPATGHWTKLGTTRGVTFNSARGGATDAAGTSPVGRLIIQVFPRLLEHLSAAAPLVRNASRITLVTSGDRSRAWRAAIRLQFRELGRLARWIHRIDRVVYKDGFYPFDVMGLWKTRAVVGFDAHSQFLDDQRSFELIHRRDWLPDAVRPVRANFLGSRDPTARARIVDSVRAHFHGAASLTATPAKPMYWHEYSDAQPAGLDAGGFVDVLTRSDFTLCPLGYSIVTHRPMEALLRGSIPVIDENELDLYTLDLVDGRNCMAVRQGDWPAAMKRITGLSEQEIVAMRGEIAAMFETRLGYAVAARRMCHRLGVEPAKVQQTAELPS